MRNTRVIDIVAELRHYRAQIDIYDPWVDPDETEHEYGLRPIDEPQPGAYDAIVLAVGHRQFTDIGAAGIRRWGRPLHLLFDVKSVLPRDAVDARL